MKVHDHTKNDKLEPCKRCGALPVFDAPGNALSCPNGHFRVSTPAGRDVAEVWNRIQESLQDERNWGEPRKLSRKERQARFDMLRAESFRRRVYAELAEEEGLFYE